MEEEKAVQESSSPETQSASPVLQKNKPFWIIGIAIILLLFVAAAGYFLFAFQNKKQATENKIYHVGVLSALDYFYPAVDSFKDEMTRLGYIEGKNIVYDIQKGPPVGNQKIVKKFVQDKVDLIFVFPTEASLETKEVTKGTGIPVVASASYMDGRDLVENIRHPGENITGVRLPVSEISAKTFEILHEIVPKAKRVFIPYLKDYPTVKPALDAILPLAEDSGVEIVEGAFSDPSEMTKYFAARSVGDSGMDAILLITDPVSIIPAYADQFNAFALEHNLPIAAVVISESDQRSIFSSRPSISEFGRLAAPLADKIFKGIPAGDLPILTPEIDLEINHKVIQKLGLTADEGLLSRAKRIVR